MESGAMTMSTEKTQASMLPPATGTANINVGPTERIVSTFLGAAALVYGFRRLNSLSGLSALASAGMLLSRGLTGYCAVNNAFGRNSNATIRKTSAMEVNGTFTINRSRSEVYNFWRKLENLPLFMKHLEDVKEEDSVNSTWKAKIPGGIGTVTWKATITEDRPNELLRWASQPGSTIDTAGEVRFEEAPSDRGTEIKVNMTYRMPAGDLGSIAGKLFNPAVEKMMKQDLRRFKSIMETGEIPIPGGMASSEGTFGTETNRNFGSTSASSLGTITQDTDAEIVKPKRTRTRKSPDPTLQASTSSPDTTLQSSPSNDINQPTQPNLTENQLDEDRWDKAR
jgi:uncharacterized membrane protein